jgi:hypothetical protein
LKNTKSSIKIVFFRAPCRRTVAPRKDRKTDLSSSISIVSFRLWTAIFWHSVLEIIATQNINFWCVRRETKKKELDGTRDELGCEMRCEAGSNIDERANMSAIDYGTFSEKTCFRAVGFDYLFPINTVKNVAWQSISWSRTVDIEIFSTKRPLLTHVNFLLKKTIDWFY